LALSRQEFFRVLVFDECEHLHDQAHAVWSRTLPLEDIPALLQRLRQPRRSQSRAVIDRLEDALGFDEEAVEHLESAKLAWQDLRASYASLALAVQAFDAWRQGEGRARPERELHSLLREWIVDHAEDSADLLEARVEWEQAANEMDAALAALAELSARGPGTPGSTRRNLDLARTELAEQIETMRAWIPMAEGKPRFLARTFHDVEVEQRGAARRHVLSSRVLLPHEYLGDLYYPDLHGAVFVSATTWLRGSFESSLSYLGVGRPMAVAGHALRTWRAEEAFDYGRVLVCLPSDAPSPTQAGKQRFLEYVRAFVAHLAERTRGRALVLFTSHDDLRRVALELEGFFRARRLPLLWQGMPGSSKEELAELFRARVDSTLLGVDTFWHGADFPGETLEHLVIVKLPFGVPDRYHHAQCAALGQQEQERAIYKPRALAKLRQGFGRLMRRETDRGVVWLLDHRVSEPRHREFLRELPLADLHPDQAGARLVRATTEQCLQKSFAFMSLLADIRRRSLDTPFQGPVERRLDASAGDARRDSPPPRAPRRVEEEPPDISSEELPF
jgi:ATP-dependent DNA helicase DinG